MDLNPSMQVHVLQPIWAIPAETAGNGKDNVSKKSFSNVQ